MTKTCFLDLLDITTHKIVNIFHLFFSKESTQSLKITASSYKLLIAFTPVWGPILLSRLLSITYLGQNLSIVFDCSICNFTTRAPCGRVTWWTAHLSTQKGLQDCTVDHVLWPKVWSWIIFFSVRAWWTGWMPDPKTRERSSRVNCNQISKLCILMSLVAILMQLFWQLNFIQYDCVYRKTFEARPYWHFQ